MGRTSCKKIELARNKNTSCKQKFNGRIGSTSCKTNEMARKETTLYKLK